VGSKKALRNDYNFYISNAKLKIIISTCTFLIGNMDAWLDLLKPNDIYIYIYRIAALTSRRYILNIYSTNIRTEYFKHAA